MSSIDNDFTTRREAREAAPRAGKRRPVIAFVLAVLAVGGIGAAATSAAWTDNVLFSAQAEAATFALKGSLNGTDYVESDENGLQLVVPADRLANLLPGQTRTIELWVANEGSVSAALVGSAAFATSTFATVPTVALSGLSATLTPAGTDGAANRFQLTVTTPASWGAENQRGTGTIVVTITGTATA